MRARSIRIYTLYYEEWWSNEKKYKRKVFEIFFHFWNLARRTEIWFVGSVSWHIIRFLTAQKEFQSATHSSFFACWHLHFFFKRYFVIETNIFCGFVSVFELDDLKDVVWYQLLGQNLGSQYAAYLAYLNQRVDNCFRFSITLRARTRKYDLE